MYMAKRLLHDRKQSVLSQLYYIIRYFFVKCFVVHTLKSITLGEEDCRFLSNKSMSLSKSASL